MQLNHTSPVLALALALALALVVGCSSTTDSTNGPTPAAAPAATATATEPTAPPPGPGAFTADYKTSALFFTAMKAPIKGTSPHGTAQIWYSSNVKEMLGEASFTVPEGTTSIKEFDMDGDGKLDGLAVMIKKPAGYDPANNDWYYDMRDTSGTVMADPPAGKVSMCIGCHAGYKANDFLAGTKLR